MPIALDSGTIMATASTRIAASTNNKDRGRGSRSQLISIMPLS